MVTVMLDNPLRPVVLKACMRASVRLYAPLPFFWYLKTWVPALDTIEIFHIILEDIGLEKRVNIRYGYNETGEGL